MRRVGAGVAQERVNNDHERGLLGALFIEGERIAAPISIGLAPEHFQERRHGLIYAAMLTAFDRQLPIDPSSVIPILTERGQHKEIGGNEYLLDLLGCVTSTAHATFHAGVVLRRARVRNLTGLCQRLLQDLPSLDITSDDALGETLAKVEREAAAAQQPLTSSVEPVLVRSSDFEPVEPEWLWHPYIPKNKLTFLEGDPGNGKTFLALHIAACITTGRALYGAQPTDPANVLYLSAEDGIADTLALRLHRSGADRSRIFHMQGVRRRGQLDEAIYFNDRDALNIALDKIRPALVVWDPMQAYFPADVNINAANETRPHMTALRDLAEAHGCSQLVIRHHRKGSGSAITKGMGSMDLSGAARSVLVVGVDDENDDYRILAHGKSSLAKKGDSLRFEILNTAVNWLGVAETSADDLALGEQQPKCSDAVDFLRDALAKGPRESKEIEQEAKAQGLSARTLDRARTKLHVRASRLHPKSPWVIELPSMNGHVSIEQVSP